MLAQRQFFTHAPPTIPIPVQFRNEAIEVLFLRLDQAETAKTASVTDTHAQVQRILSAAPAKLTALSLDTTCFKFDREEANAR